MQKHPACAKECQQAVDYGVDGMAACSPSCVYLRHHEQCSALAWRAYSKAWPEAMAGPSAGLPALLAASRSAVARMREVDAVLSRGGQRLLGHTLHMPALLLETAAKDVNLGAIEWSQPGALDWSETP